MKRQSWIKIEPYLLGLVVLISVLWVALFGLLLMKMAGGTTEAAQLQAIGGIGSFLAVVGIAFKQHFDERKGHQAQLEGARLMLKLCAEQAQTSMQVASESLEKMGPGSDISIMTGLIRESHSAIGALDLVTIADATLTRHALEIRKQIFLALNMEEWTDSTRVLRPFLLRNCAKSLGEIAVQLA